MATYKVLGQLNPSATTETTLYTAPSAAIVSTLMIANTASTTATFRVAVRPAADSTTATKHWIVYGATVLGSDSTALTLGITLATGDKIQVFASTANLSFSAFGSEV